DDGLTFDAQYTQFAQGLVAGGLDDGWHFPASLDVVTQLDLQRVADVPVIVTLRTEPRFGRNVNAATGMILPANTDAAYPITDPPDRNLPLAITELNASGPAGEQWWWQAGKIMTFSGDPSEFAGGAGRDQFQNSALVSSPVTQLTVPYGTLALGAEWTPSERVAVSSTLMNTADSSTTSGLEHLDDGVTWISEADWQGRLGGLPGGMNLGALYAFDGDYRQ